MNKTEKICYKYLIDNGYVVQKPCPTTRWGQKDMFNLFDFIAIAPDGYTRNIQVSVQYKASRDAEWKHRFNNFPLSVVSSKEFWRYNKDKKLIRVTVTTKEEEKKYDIDPH